MSDVLERMTTARGPWTSDLLRRWYPPQRLHEALRASMATDAAWVGDAAFGAGFRDAVAVVPVPDPLDWADRWVDLPGGQWCVTGTRFRGRDVTRPFVDVVATSVPPTAEALAGVCAAVLPRYAPFAPRAVRVDAPDPDALVAEVAVHPAFAGASVDQYVVAGRVADLVARPPAPGTDRVRLEPVGVDEAGPAARACYEQARAQRPDLPQWASVSTDEELAACHAEGLLFRVVVDGSPAGVVAARRDDDHAMTGFVVQEIVLDDAHRGRRLGAPVLQRLTRALPAGDGDTLWGTVHPDNLPSLRNARSVGREVVGGYVWLVPAGLPGM